MPLYKTIHHDANTQIYIWKITETLQELNSDISLSQNSYIRLNKMKSELHKKGFLCVRKLLEVANYSDFDLKYKDSGKPYLNDNKHISISHAHQFAAIAISNKPVGIDIELEKEKIIVIANKFLNEKEFHFLDTQNQENYIRKLTAIWGAKEAVFKVTNEQGVSFKDHICLNQFEISIKSTKALLNFRNSEQHFVIHFEQIENYILAYAF